MHKLRLYLTQLLGVIILLCSYLVKNPPDSLSVMHVAPHPNHESVIRNAQQESRVVGATTHLTDHSDTEKSHKTKITKYTSFDVMLPKMPHIPFAYVAVVRYLLPLPASYNYLYFKEVNPPPPEIC